MRKEVLSVVHGNDPSHIKYFWWYDTINDVMEGHSLDSKVQRHISSFFTPVKNHDERGWVKGRIILFQSKIYLLIHSIGYQGHSIELVEKIYNRLEDLFHIDYVINESAEIIYP